MKNVYIGVGVLVVIVAVVVGVLFLNNKDDKTTSKTDTPNKSTSAFTATIKSACDILTQPVADNLLGTGAKQGGSTAGNTETDSVKVTSCSYTSADDKTTLGLLVRAAKTKEQADTDTTQFSGTDNVAGYGDKAYWASDFGQFNILAHNNWYILSFGSLNPTARSQADAQKFADQIKSEL